MYDTVHFVDRIFVCSGFGSFKTAALVDGYIHHDRSGFHQFEHVACDQRRRFCARDQHAANDQVSALDELADVVFIGHNRVHVGRHNVFQIAKACQADIDDCYIGSQSRRHFSSLGAYNPAAKHEHIRWFYTCHAAKQDAESPHWLFEVFGAFLDRHTPGYFAHRNKQRKASVCLFYGFISEANCFALDHGMGEGLGGGEVEVGEQELVFLNEWVFTGDWLLHFDDHLGNAVNFFDGW